MDNLLKGFEEFLNEQYSAILEASNLAKLNIPKEMISAIHQKSEQKAEEFPNLGFVYRSENPLVLPYKYKTPSHEIEIGEPQTFTGKKVPVPEGEQRTSPYPDFGQYLIDLPQGPLSLLITRPEDDIYLYFYYKSPRQGGDQYAILAWDKNKKQAVDFAYVGLTVEGVEKQLVREVHKTKGGNTNQKVQELINMLVDGNRVTADKPITIYELTSENIETPEKVRTERKATKNYGPYPTPSLNFIELFANKLANLIKPGNKYFDLLKSKASRSQSASNMQELPEINKLAEKLGTNPKQVLGYLYLEFVKFRAKLYEEGRVGDVATKSAYHRTDGFELFNENKFAVSIGLASRSKGRDLPISKQFSSPYKFGSIYDPKDPRYTEDEKKSLMRQKGQRVPYHLPPERVKRTIPDKGNYASLDSMIRLHSLDGLVHRFTWFILTGKITEPATNFLYALGLDVDNDEEGLGDLEKLVL